MADNVTIGSAVGVVGADEVTDATLGTVKVQYVKLMDGTLDSTTKIGGTNGLPTSLATRLDPVNDSITNLPFGHSFTRIVPAATATTVLVKSGAGVLASVLVGVRSTGAATVTLYDSLTATGAIVGVINTTDAGVGSIMLNTAFAIGLTAATSTSTTGVDLTVMWR